MAALWTTALSMGATIKTRRLPSVEWAPTIRMVLSKTRTKFSLKGLVHSLTSWYEDVAPDG
ncbi:hypothetical protein ACHAWF_011701 [Thalassiosira exigua]